MKLAIDNTSPIPVFQQIIDQLHFSINTGELAPAEKLPSIRNLAKDNGLAANTVAKALRQLEFRGVIEAKDRSGFTVAIASGAPSATAQPASGPSWSKSWAQRRPS